MPHTLVQMYQHSEETYCLYLKNTLYVIIPEDLNVTYHTHSGT